MKILIIVMIWLINRCFTVNVIKWDKRVQDFLPISNIEEFKIMQEKRLKDIYETEKHNFHKEKINLIYYEDKDCFEFYDGDTKATGICGDIWTILSEYLNFTLVLTKSKIRTLGTKTAPKEYFTGLLGMLERKEYTVIPRMEAYSVRLQAVDFSKTLWRDRHRFFMKPNYQFKLSWMLELFSWKIWCLIIVYYVLSSILNIFSSKLLDSANIQNLITSSVDYFFYAFGVLCNQGDVLFLVQRKFKLLSFCYSMFAWLLLTSFSSQLIIFMTHTDLISPFKNMETLFHNTDYTILAEKFSLVNIAFQKKVRPIYTLFNEANRIHYYNNYEEMWEMACSDEEKYTVLQSEFLKINKYLKCDLDPTGDDYYATAIVAGIVKGFKYTKTINLGILRLHESGIMNALKSRWLQIKDPNRRLKKDYAPITLNQVFLIICTYIFGVCASIFIVITEKIIYFCKKGKP